MDNEIDKYGGLPEKFDPRKVLTYLRSLPKDDLVDLTLESVKEVREIQHKADFYDRVTQTEKWIDLSKSAKILNFKNVGRNNLFYILRKIGILQNVSSNYNEPKQANVNAGHFVIKEKETEIKPGWTKIYTQTLVSQKGLNYIRKKLEEYGFEYNND